MCVGGRGGAGEAPTAAAPSTVTLQTEQLLALQLSLQEEFNYITLRYITFVQRNTQINYITRRCLNKLYAGVGTITIQSSCLNLKHLHFMSAYKRTLVRCYSRYSTALHSRRRSKGKLQVQRAGDCIPYSVRLASVDWRDAALGVLHPNKAPAGAINKLTHVWKYFVAMMTNMAICVASLGAERAACFFFGDDWHLRRLTEGTAPQC
jgi:hypothetical protein